MAEAIDEPGTPRRRRLLFLRRRPIYGGVECLSKRVAAAVDDHLRPGESVRFCLRGDLNHSLVALDERMLIVKPGFHAGTTFGTLVTTIFYSDITAMQVQTYLMAAWIEISSPSFQGRERKRNRQPRTSDRDVYKLPNCVPIKRKNLRECRSALADLVDLVTNAKRSAADERSTQLAGQLAQLAELRDSGGLTEDEFERAKALVLVDRPAA